MKSINKEILKRVIIENREYITKIPGILIDRDIAEFPESIKKVVVLYGVRRSGKTHILYQLLRKNSSNSMYIDFEDERLHGFSIDDFETLREAFYELFPKLTDEKVYFLLDEVQIVEGWEKFCRRIVEKSPAEVVAAGSSSRIYPENISTQLRGRAWSLEVFPFSFKEFVILGGIKPNELTMASDKRFTIVSFFEEYIKWGGFPEVIRAANDYEKQKISGEYLEAIFFKDLVERYDISNLQLLKNLRNKIFSSFSTRFTLNSFYNKMKGSFPFSMDLLTRYYQHLLDSKSVFEIRIYSDSEYKRARNPAKVYIIDPVLANKVAHDDSARILENIVFIELLRRGYRIHYFDQDGECDFAAVKNDKPEVIQVTYRIEEGNRSREIEGLVKAACHLRVKQGSILTFDEEGELVEKGIEIKIVPAWKWLLKDTGS